MEAVGMGVFAVTSAGDFMLDGDVTCFTNRTDKLFVLEVRRGGITGPLVGTCALPPHGGHYSPVPYGGMLHGVFAVKVVLVTEPVRR